MTVPTDFCALGDTFLIGSPSASNAASALSESVGLYARQRVNGVEAPGSQCFVSGRLVATQ